MCRHRRAWMKQYEYDYVIVGGGSAGCVLANRLSEDPDTSVCLLEAGPRDWNPLIRIPIGIIGLMRSRLFNWRYYTAPQQHLNNRRMFWPRGKTLGGSSSINAMCYTRGAGADYDDWAAQGNRGWGYDDMLAYFRACECYEEGGGRFHGSGGSYCVSQLRFSNPLNEKFLAAAEACGYPLSDDFNGASQYGFGLYRVAQADGRRCSNADAFLHPVERERDNLTVITGARATRVLFRDRRAIGVEFRRRWRRRTQTAGAAREVVLCGGAVNSPQLLLLSGVGAPGEIEPHGIDVVRQLEGVGRNLQDHLDVSVIELERTRLSLRPGLKRLLLDGPRDVYQYFLRRRGQLTSNVAESGGFVCCDDERGLCDLQFHFIPAIEQEHGLDLSNTVRRHGYTLRVCDLRPESHGSIGLSSADPMADARIDPNYLDCPRDLARLVRAIGIARRILRTPPMANHRLEELEPGDTVASDSGIEAHVRRRAETIYHPAGTCRMGHDDAAVVDDRLRVHGLQGIRVADASIMPTLIGGNTNAPTTAIAAKAADMILADNAAAANAEDQAAEAAAVA